MTTYHHQNKRGFSLVELAIVLGVMGVVMASIWGYAGSAHQTQKVTQATQQNAALVDAVRMVYAGKSSIVGSMPQVETVMMAGNSMPSTFLRPQTGTCGTPAVTSNYLDTPWGDLAGDACGSLHLCAWSYTNATSYGVGAAPNIGATPCASVAAGASAQNFAIEYTQLSFGSCVALAGAIDPAAPSGLSDVYINGNSIVNTGSGLPVVSAQSSAKCAAASTNIVDFVYTLRPPGT